MKVERISNNCIKCAIDQYELLYNYDIDINAPESDFMNDLHERLIDIAKDCYENLGEELKPGPLDCRLLPPKDGIVEIEFLSGMGMPSKMGMAGLLGALLGGLAGVAPNGKMVDDEIEEEARSQNDTLNDLADLFSGKKKEEESEEESDEIDEISIYQTNSLSNMINFAKVIKGFGIDSKLLKYNDQFYLRLSKHNKRIDMTAVEYGCKANGVSDGFLEERADVIVGEKAIESLTC